MKKLLLVAIVLFQSLLSNAQVPTDPFLTFDGNDNYTSFLTIDNINYPNNNWQVGKPQKQIFSGAYTIPNALVTDTTHPFVANATSVAYFKFATHPGNYPLYFISFQYDMDIDTTDFASVDYSIDSGKNWIVMAADSFHVIHDSLSNLQFGNGELHSNRTWNSTFYSWGEYYFATAPVDTVIFRFRFIAGNNTAAKDGWMIDDIDAQYSHDQWLGIPQLYRSNLVQIYPNPSDGNVFLKDLTGATKANVVINSVDGRDVYCADNVPTNQTLHLSLPAGQYLLKYQNSSGTQVQQLIIK